MRLKERDRRIAEQNGHYHSKSEYARLKQRFENNPQPVKNGKFHKLAKRLEASIPRGLRASKCASTTELYLEVSNDEKLTQSLNKKGEF